MRYNGAGAVPGLNRNHLHKLRVTFPGDVESQRRIVCILAQYDDLINNNSRRIELLIEATQHLYKEWFVRLRFPGYQCIRIIEGVPKGWSPTTIKPLCESVDYGFTASASLEQIGPKFLRITDIVPHVLEWDAVPYCEIPSDREDKFTLQAGDVVVARTGATVGFAKRIHKRYPKAVFASYLVRLRCRTLPLSYLVGTFVESEGYKQYIRTNVGGAAQPNANAQIIAKAPILLPPENVLADFQALIEPLLDQRDNLVAQNAILREARALLLPRLVRGDAVV